MNRTEVARYWEANAETWTRHAPAVYDIYRDGPKHTGLPRHAAAGQGLTGLDIGCGEGSNTRELVRLGARMQAVDIAPTFIRHAQDAETPTRSSLPTSSPMRPTYHSVLALSIS